MSSGLTIAKRLDIIERSTSTSIVQRKAVTATTGTTNGSAGVGPAANLRWLVQAIGVEVSFQASPAASDDCAGNWQLVRSAIFHSLIGVEVEGTFGRKALARGFGGWFVMVNGDTFRAFASALGSSVSVAAVASLVGFEYEEI